MATLLALRRLILWVADRLRWLPPTLTRLSVGWLFLQTGWSKLHNLEKIVDYFRDLGIPHPEVQAPFAASAELVCGTLLFVGLMTRLACIPLTITMVVAIVTARREDFETVSSLYGFIEYTYILLFVWLGVVGPGPISIDALLVRLFARNEKDAHRDP
jgi:putative oxidoreductase